MNVNEATNLYMQVMEYERGTEENEIGVSKVVEKIQDLLGINELTKLRKQVIKEANKALETTV
jgi:tRNA uridine 5-carbamoylmethylation protein Kti12